MYDKKLLEEFRKYGAVTCSSCKKRNRTKWNIYSANTFCSQECISKGIEKLLVNGAKTLLPPLCMKPIKPSN